MADDCVTPPQPPTPRPAHASNEYKFRYDLGQVIDGGMSIVDTCFYSAGGQDGTQYIICGNLIADCVMCKE